MKIVGIVLFSAGVAMFLIRTSLHYDLSWNHPREPHPESGAIYPLNNHGSIVYLTHDENVLMTTLWYGGMVGGAFGAMLVVLAKRRVERSFSDPKS